MTRRRRLLVTAPFIILFLLCFIASLFLPRSAFGWKIALGACGGLLYVSTMQYLVRTPVKHEPSAGSDKPMS